MKGLVFWSTLVLVFAEAISLQAAETKLEGRIYTGWSLNATADSGSSNAFNLDRSYLTAKSKLSDYTSANITIDIRSIKNYDGYAMVIKYAYAAWKPKFVADYITVTMGLQPTKYLETIDGAFWGRRYVEKSIGDYNSFLSTADLGMSLDYNLGKQGTYGNAGLSIYNGTKYSELTEKNKRKDFNPYLIVKPVANNAEFGQSTLAAQFYSGSQNIAFNDTLKAGDYCHQIVSVGGNVVYKKTFNLGFDLNWNTLGQGKGKNDKKQTALSGFGALSFGELVDEKSPLRTLGLFGRIDVYDPDMKVNKDGNTKVIAGLECAPIKGVMASVNYRTTRFQDDDTKATHYVFLNSEFRF